jgi:hypothetical protein
MDGLYFPPHVAAAENFHQAISIKAEMLIISSTRTKLSFGAMLDGLLLLIPICFILFKAISGLTVAYIWKLARDKKRLSINYPQQIPCKTCRFFTNNHYLKCAVNPSTALTKQAFNCSDYLPQDRPDSSLPVPVVSATVFDPQTQSWYSLRNLYENSESVWAVAPFLDPRPAIPSSTPIVRSKKETLN